MRSGHGVGKSTTMAWAALWHMHCYYPQKTPCTAPTLHQLEDVLWAEIGMWHQRLPTGLREQIVVKDLRMELAAAPDESFATARTGGNKQTPEALQGFHSPHLLFLIDEASGVEEVVFQVAEGALTGHNSRVLMASNPTRLSGYFYDSHHKVRHLWYPIHVSCMDSNLVTEKYIESMRIKYGEDSDVWRIRVLGEFPVAGDDILMPLDLVMAATEREVEPVTSMMPVWGLDVARFGSCKTALAKRQANRLVEPVKSWYKRDLMDIAGRVLDEYENTSSDLMPAEIIVDSIGIGAGVLDRLYELGLPVRGVNVGETPSGKDRFTRLRDELWWRAREWFEGRDVTIPEDDELIAQLTDVRYRFGSNGKIQIERKEEMMDRGVASPDIADAFVLTMAGVDRRGVGDRYQRKQKTKATGSRWTR